MNRIESKKSFFRIVVLLIAAITIGCRSVKVPAQKLNPASPSPASDVEYEPRVLRIRLTLNSPSELLVRQGDRIEPRTLLTDRSRARERLRLQITALEDARTNLRRQLRLTDASTGQLESLGSELPPASFATEQTAIRRAETAALSVDRKVKVEEGEIAGLADGTALTDDQRRLIIEHEEAKLLQARDERLLSLTEIEWHKARLVDARDARAFEEKRHRIDYVRQLLSAREQREQSLLALSQVAAQIIEARLRLEQVAEVRAPFGGLIRRIDWEEMNDERIIVALYLAPGR